MILWLFDGAATKLRPLFPVPPTLFLSLLLSPPHPLLHTCINKSADTTEKKEKCRGSKAKRICRLTPFWVISIQKHNHTYIPLHTHTHIFPYIYSYSHWQKKNKALQRKTLKNVAQQKGKSYYGKERIKISSWMQLCTCVCVSECVCVCCSSSCCHFPTRQHFSQSTHTLFPFSFCSGSTILLCLLFGARHNLWSPQH